MNLAFLLPSKRGMTLVDMTTAFSKVELQMKLSVCNSFCWGLLTWVGFWTE